MSIPEKTFCMLKPDTVRRGVMGEIITRIERSGLKISAVKMIQPDKELAGKHYTYEDIAVRHGEDVRNRLIRFIVDGPVLAMVVEGIEAVAVLRKLCGSTEPLNAAVGTIRGDYCHHTYELAVAKDQAIRNIIHASATLKDAEYEIGLWFDDSELVDYRRNDEAEHYLD